MEYWWLLLHWCHNLILFSASYRRQVLVCLRFATSQHAGVPTQPETLPAMLQLNHAGSFKKLKSSQVQAVRGIWFARVFCFHAPQVFFYRIFDSVVLPYFLPKPKFFRWKVGASSGAKRRLRRLLPHWASLNSECSKSMPFVRFFEVLTYSCTLLSFVCPKPSTSSTSP